MSWAREIGRANVFYSHTQKLDIDETLDTLDLTDLIRLACQTRRYWVDYLVIRQLADNDFKTDEIACVIGTIGRTLAECDEELAYIHRSFCIFEIGATTAVKGKLHWVQKLPAQSFVANPITMVIRLPMESDSMERAAFTLAAL